MRTEITRVVLLALLCMGLLDVVFAADPGTKMTPEEVANIDLGITCITAECHGDMGKMKFQHGPMNFAKCEPCHIPTGAKHVFEQRPGGRVLCLKCHELAESKKVQHKPFVEDCSTCHYWHESDTRYHVKGGTGAAGCLQNCHEDFPKNQKFQHTALKETGCLACHTSHQSDYPHLLTDDRKDMCLKCHSDFPERIQNATSVHAPVLEGDCTACHSAHGGETQFRMPEDDKEFCRKCHEDVIRRMEHLDYPHGAMVEKNACRNCHEVHMSSHGRLLSKSISDLCLDCHNKEIKVGDRVLRDISQELKDMPYHHGPVKQKNCVACHRAHGTNYPYLLTAELTKEFYASTDKGAYEMCFECHDRSIVEKKEFTETGFRNGNKNLHFTHVSGKKGRACHVCHQSHGSTMPFLLRPEIPYGKFNMKLDYVRTPTGGACQTLCHAKYVYNRPFPWDNSDATETTMEDVRKLAGDTKDIILPALTLREPAPDFTLKDDQGKEFRLDALSSTTLLVFLGPSDYYAARELGTINHAVEKHPGVASNLRRWVVLGKGAAPVDIEYVRRQGGEAWTILLDPRDQVFASYHVIATPTTVLADAEGRIRSLLPGYDVDIATKIHHELDRIMGVPSHDEKVVRMSATDLKLQVARRLSERGLWESALDYYNIVTEERGMSFLPLVEQAEIYLEIREPDKALEIINKISPTAVNELRMINLRIRAAQIKSKTVEERKPPAVIR